MLNLNCIICAELFTHADNVFITPCGHMFHKPCLDQWLARAKTCPQCRHKCLPKSVFRVFFNQTNVDLDQSSAESIQERLDNANLQLRLKEGELKKAQEERDKLSNSQKKNMKTIAGLEKKMDANKFLVQSFEEQLKLVRQENNTLKNMCSENERLRSELEVMRTASSVLVASIAESEKILETEKDVKKLTAWVSTLKRELEQCKNKKNYIQEQLHKIREDFRKETDAKKALEERVKELNSELYKLTPKHFETATKSENVPIKRPPKEIEDIFNEHEKSMEIKQTNSPFLNIKSCSIGLGPLVPSRRAQGIFAAKSNISPNKVEPYAVYKKPRLESALLVSSRSVPNGLFESERDSPIMSKQNDFRMKYVPEPTTTSEPLTLPNTSLNSRLKTGKLRNFSINFKRDNRDML